MTTSNPWDGWPVKRLTERTPPTGPRSEYVAAFAEGARASSAGLSGDVCPYTVEDRPVARVGWRDGWASRTRTEGRPLWDEQAPPAV